MNAGIQGWPPTSSRWRWSAWTGPGGRRHAARLILQVHDEVILEVPPEEEEAAEAATRAALQGAADLRIPLEVNLTWAPPGLTPRVEVPHFFEPIAAHLGSAYLRYSFTKGTAQEVAFLVDELGLGPATRVLDPVRPGRHARALAERGIEVVGVDISERFIELARDGAPASATFVVADARELAYDGEFDAAISLCQGAFGLVPGEDGEVLRRSSGP